jgi:hypothetical protein
MPVRNGETVYVGASFTWEIPAVTLRGALMTASNPPDTFTFTVMLGSATSAQGSMTHVPRGSIIYTQLRRRERASASFTTY